MIVNKGIGGFDRGDNTWHRFPNPGAITRCRDNKQCAVNYESGFMAWYPVLKSNY